MNIINSFIAFNYLFLTTFVIAQTNTSRWSSLEYHLQNRQFHRGMGYQSFRTQIDIGLGLNKKAKLTNGLNLELGLTVNYGRFKSKAEGTLFISSFKKTNIHYFSHNLTDQLSMEIPIGLEANILKIGVNNLQLNFGFVPQIGLLAVHKGIQWDQKLTIRESLLTKSEKYFDSRVLSDLYIRTGFSYRINRSRLNIGAGLEYSTFEKSLGMYSKFAFSLN